MQLNGELPPSNGNWRNHCWIGVFLRRRLGTDIGDDIRSNTGQTHGRHQRHQHLTLRHQTGEPFARQDAVAELGSSQDQRNRSLQLHDLRLGRGGAVALRRHQLQSTQVQLESAIIRAASRHCDDRIELHERDSRVRDRSGRLSEVFEWCAQGEVMGV